jgi:hypothetical protein
MKLLWWRAKPGKKDDRKAALKAMKSIRRTNTKTPMSRGDHSGYSASSDGSI